MTLAAAGAGLVALLLVNSTLTGASTYTGGAPTSTSATTPALPTTPTQSTGPSPSIAPSPPSQTPPRTTPVRQVVAVYAGHLQGGPAGLAIAVKGGRSVAYYCDGRRVESWLTGTESAGRVALRSKTGDRLAGTAAATSVTGVVTVGGQRLPFTMPKVGPPAGLYRAKTSSSTIGWIVLPNGKQVGIDDDGTPGPAPPLVPQSGTARLGGTTVAVTSITGDETF
ncbi:MAG TPA: hypothetical protein VGL05_28785 [Kribbella sp.]